MAAKSSAERCRPVAGAALPPRLAGGLLLLILLVGTSLRFYDLTRSPPGLNQDEAANAWNAWCLLHTGADQTGQRWPIFATRCHGGYSSTPFIYWTIPFQAVGGLNVWTTRLPAAVAGVLSLVLVYDVGARLFGTATGLAAAALMALNPWHLQQSRWGHEAALCPLLVAATLAALVWAGLPLADDARRPRWWAAGLAGLVAGASCYGYQAMRAFLPAVLVFGVLLTWRAWWQCLKTPAGRRAVGALALGLCVTVGPLAWRHLAAHGQIGRQLESYKAWSDDDSPARKALKVLGRYPCHFGPRFLFLRGDGYPIQSPPGMGMFHGYMVPLFLAGSAVVLWRCRSRRAHRLLLAAVLVYPLGDCLTRYDGAHALRSLPGLVGLILLAAVGLVAIGRWLITWNRRAAWAGAVAFAAVVAVLNVGYLARFFGPFNRDPVIYHSFHADLLEACRWLRPRFDGADAVFVTTRGMNMPYVITLVGLQYDPRRWLADVHEVQTVGTWDYHKRYGKMFFIYDASAQAALNQLTENGRKHRVYLILRPEEAGPARPVRQIARPDNRSVLWICEVAS